MTRWGDDWCERARKDRRRAGRERERGGGGGGGEWEEKGGGGMTQAWKAGRLTHGRGDPIHSADTDREPERCQGTRRGGGEGAWGGGRRRSASLPAGWPPAGDPASGCGRG